MTEEETRILKQAETLVLLRAVDLRTIAETGANAEDRAVCARRADQYAIAADGLQRVLGVETPSLRNGHGQRIGARVVAAVVSEESVPALHKAIAKAFPVGGTDATKLLAELANDQTPPKRERFQHSVVEIATILAGHATGSMSGDYRPDLPELRDWLAWRVEEGWVESALGSATLAYDSAIREAGRAAVAMFDKERDDDAWRPSHCLR